jgi:hypothetical protein
MINKHTPESIVDAINVTLQEIQNVIYDYWAVSIPWSQANARIQRHALELRLLNQGDLPPKGEPLIVARASADAIERARAARERLREGGSEHSTTGSDQAAAPAGELVEPTAAEMSYAAGTLEEGSADVFRDRCVSCGKNFGSGSRGICVGHAPDHSGLLVMCHDCAGTDLPSPAP